MLEVCENNNQMYPWCGACKHATNRREWDDKIDYGNGTYDIIYCEEITCKLNGRKYHPQMFGCDGEHFEER